MQATEKQKYVLALLTAFLLALILVAPTVQNVKDYLLETDEHVQIQMGTGGGTMNE